MAALLRHIIQRQVMELYLSAGTDHRAIQNAVADILKNDLLPLLDEIFTSQTADVGIYIPHLEIDLGRVSLHRLKEELVERIAETLQKKLEEIQPPVTISLQNHTGNSVFPEVDASTSKQDTNQSQPTHAPLNLVLYFLQTGFLPWWAQESGRQYLTDKFLDLIERQPAEISRLLPSILKSPTVLQRLVNTFEAALLTQLVGLTLESAVLQVLLQQNKTLSTIFLNKLSPEQLQLDGWVAILQTTFIAKPQEHHEILRTTAESFIILTAEKIGWPDVAFLFHQKEKVDLTVADELVAFIKRQLATKEQFSAKNLSLSPKTATKTVKEPKQIFKKTDAQKPGADVEKVYIQNAGLVLLWPFLSRFFQHLKLADEAGFVEEAMAERACLLLQYLATGTSDDILEAQLPLNKLLSGVPLLHPLPTRWEIQPEEAEEASHFLEAVIQNGGEVWKNLSVRGLRQAYLLREGILSSRDGSWLLQVERKPYDVLLERLPWTVSIIKLPWMERLIFVEW